MDKSSSFRQIKIYYYRYKDTHYFTYAIIGGIALLCLLQLLIVIIPVWSRLQIVQTEINAVEKNIQTMLTNQQYISTINPVTQESQKSTVLAALPITKDYAGIYNAVITGASRTGVALGGFSYEVGTLDSSANDGLIAELKVTLMVGGPLQSVNNFIQSLQELLPLSEVNGYNGDSGSSTVLISFYYGGQKLPIAVDNTQPIQPLTPEKESLLNTLTSYMPQVEPVFEVVSTGSESAFSEAPF